MTEASNRRRKDSAKLVWDTKPKRAPNPKDIEFQTAEIVIPNPKTIEGSLDLSLFATPQAGLTSLFPAQFGELPLGGQEIDKTRMNRLIWGDNLLAMQALLAQGYAGKIDLIYIDPPFNSDADYSFQLTVEGQQVDKDASIIERLAYTDTWESGIDSYLDMLCPRLQLMKRLLSDIGNIYVHVDWHVSHYVKTILDEVFGVENFKNEVVWVRTAAKGLASKKLAQNHDVILNYQKSDASIWNYGALFIPYDLEDLDEKTASKYSQKDADGRLYQLCDLTNPNPDRPNLRYEFLGVMKVWRWTKQRMQEAYDAGLVIQPSLGSVPRYKRYLDEQKGKPLGDVWSDISPINSQAKERLNYPTQKPESLIERIISIGSNENSLIADFFCGSGTTMAVAERLNRRWIGCNLDKVGLQVSRNRMVEQAAKPFLLENIGNYQRHMIYLSGSKIGEMQRIVLKLYGAEPRKDRPDLGIRTFDNGDTELVYVGYPDRPVTAKKVIELAQDAQVLNGTGYLKLVVLAWDYDYNFSTELESRKKILGDKSRISVQTLSIPPEIYNYLKKAKNEDELESLRDKLIFHEKPYLKISKPNIRDAGDGKVHISVSIDRYVLMSFPVPEKQQAELRKAIKDNFAALIDYWAIDWDYDGITFRSTWQAIRGNGKRAATVPIFAESPELPEGKRTISVRLVDIFGNDASSTIEVK